jgi:hypothetical protein
MTDGALGIGRRPDHHESVRRRPVPYEDVHRHDHATTELFTRAGSDGHNGKRTA